MNEQRRDTYMRFIKYLSAVCLCLGAAAAVPAFSVSADSADEEKSETETAILNPFATDNWEAILYDVSNGLPSSEANDIVNTPDGFIWIGSYSGLVRYDGNTFERITSEQGITSVKTLYTDSVGRLWIGTNDHGVFMMDRGEIHHWDVNSGLEAGTVRDILEGNSGDIYVATTGGLAVIDKDFNCSMFNNEKLSSEFIIELERGTGGLIYGLTNSGDIFSFKHGSLISIYDHESTGIPEGVSSIFPDPDHPGYIYFETKSNKVYYASILNRLKDPVAYDVSPLYEIQDFTMIDGRIWICARNGIGVLEDGEFRLLEDVPMNNSIVNMTTDYEGNLWFTSSRQGVMKITPNPFMELFENNYLPSRMVNTTCMYDGILYVGTDSGLAAFRDDEPVSEIPISSAVTAGGSELEVTNLLDYLSDVRIRSIRRDSKDRLWICTWRNSGLFCLDHGALTKYTAEDGLVSDQIRIVCELSDGTIAAAHSGGISLIRDGQVVRTYTEADGIANTEILNVTEGLNGDILCGSDGDGIYIIKDDGIYHIGWREGLESESIMRLKKDEKRDLIWIISGNSIGWLDHDYNVTIIRNFPFTNNFDLYENDAGEMWVLSSNGIYTLPAETLLADQKDMKCIHYTISDGLPSITTANSYSELTADGTLYMAATTGVIKVNINHAYDRLGDTRVSVPFAEADGVMVYPDENGVLYIGKDTRRLTIYPYVFNYSLADPVVTYRLDGFDSTGTTVSRVDLDPVVYTNLAGGTYHFILEAEDMSGQESRGTSVTIIKPKHLYEEAWFYIVAAVADIALIFWLVHHFVRRNQLKMEKKQQEEAEKQRISTELNMATRLQASMLPSDFPPYPDRREFDIYAIMDPAREVGGDFYDFFLIDNDHLGLVMADVSGKGVPGALFMMISKTILQSCAQLGRSPAEILSKTNEALCSSNKMQMFVTAWVGIIEISSGRLTAANAGHEYPVIRRSGSRFEVYKDRHGLVLGAMDGVPYHEYEIQLNSGDEIFLYTDGIPEAIRKDNEAFGTDRMLEALNEETEDTPQAILKNVRSRLDEFTDGAEQFDDVTMLCFRYNGNAQSRCPDTK